jgi:hypothetical protein
MGRQAAFRKLRLDWRQQAVWAILHALEVDSLHLGGPEFGQDFRDQMVRLG